MSCTQVQNKLWDELSTGIVPSAQIADHLQSCSDCSREEQFLFALKNASALDEPAFDECLGRVRQKLQARIAATACESQHVSTTARFGWMRWACAAAFVFSMLSICFSHKSNGPIRMPQTTHATLPSQVKNTREWKPKTSEASSPLDKKFAAFMDSALALKFLNAEFLQPRKTPVAVERILVLTGALASKWPNTFAAVEGMRLKSRCFTELGEAEFAREAWIEYADARARFMSICLMPVARNIPLSAKIAQAEWSNIVRAEADSLYKAKDFMGGLALFDKVVNRFPDSDDAAYARLKFANYYEDQHRSAEAIALYEKIINDRPDSQSAYAARLALPCIYANHGNLEAAIDKWSEFASAYDTDDSRACAEFNKGSCYFARGQRYYPQAIDAYNTVLAMYPETGYAKVAVSAVENIKRQLMK